MFGVPSDVRPGSPVRAKDQNMVYAALRQLGGVSTTKNGGFQRSRVSAESHPFEISYDSTKKKVSVGGGLWIGDGISARGADFGAEGETPGDIRGQDTFIVNPTEISLEDYSPGSEEIYLAVVAKTKFGRVCPETIEDTESGIRWHTLQFEALGTSTDKTRLENLVFGMTPEAMFVGKIGRDGVVSQTIRENIRYTPANPAGMPLHFYPVDNEPNGFECLGGLLVCNIPRTLNPDEMIWTHNAPASEEQFVDGVNVVPVNRSIGGFRKANTAGGLKTLKLERRLAPIPPFSLNLDSVPSEMDSSRVNGYVVYLRVSVNYDVGSDIAQNAGVAYPMPTIAWGVVQIPKSASTPQNMWNFSTELAVYGDLDEKLSPATFLGELNGAPLQVGPSGYGVSSEMWYVQSIGLMHFIPTESYESIIPIGVFYRPYRQGISASETTSETRERYVYLPLERGIVNWTPPIDFKPWSGEIWQ